MASDTTFEYKCTLSEETLKLAKTELNEDPKTRMLELKAFRDRLVQYPGLRSRTDPEFLIRFLRARKFDQERAFQLLLNYYRMRKEDPEIFTGLKPSNISHVYKNPISFPLEQRDRNGSKIILIKPAKIDTSRYTMLDLFKAEYINLTKMIEEEENQVRGFTLILDYSDFSMQHFMMMNLDFGRRISKVWQDAFPARMKATLLVNEPHFIDLVLVLFTQFMKDKMIKRIHRIGTDWKKLHTFVDPACLPAELGGTSPQKLDPTSFIQELMADDQRMEEESKYGFVDYTIGNEVDKKQQDAITNMAGTFRKLNVD